ncbi:MAG TPA: NAD-glutamate dehydrogenase [Thermoanaerobaculia bacterium]|nr:NAD-glutamate dehydrogenase [Thermoanaerobaculia bacterium]
MAAIEDMWKAEVIERVAQVIRQRLGGVAGEGAAAFARRYYEGISADDLRARTSSELEHGPLSLWLFARKRQAGESLVQVFNPEIKEHGWTSPHTVVEMVNDDRPFLVDSVTAELHRQGLEVHLVIHPVVRVLRNEGGEVQWIVEEAAPEADGMSVESLMHFEVDRLGSAAERQRVREELLRVLARVRAAVDDWGAMTVRLEELIQDLESSPRPESISEDELAESLAFLRWLQADNMTFLGFREYALTPGEHGEVLRAVDGTGLGILRDELRVSSARERELTPEMSEFARRPELIFITKTNHLSPVHRPTHMDYVGIKRFDVDGRVLKELRFQGLFTSQSYRQLAEEVPLLRRKVKAVLQRAGFRPRGHAAKALAHILETFPRDELFQIGNEELFHTAMGILQLQERRRVALFVRKDTFERFVACLVFVPRDRYSTDLRPRLEGILERAFNGTVGAVYTHVDQEPLARIQFFLSTKPGQIPPYNQKDIEAALAETVRGWEDTLGEVLRGGDNEERAGELLRRYAGAFPIAYQVAHRPEQASFDLERVEEALQGEKLAFYLYRPLGMARNRARFKIYDPGAPLPLSEMVPQLENLGFSVVAEQPYEIRPTGGTVVWIRDFELDALDGLDFEPGDVRGRVQETLSRVRSGEAESDGLNRLVLSAGLGWRQVVILRTYSRYLRQAGISASQDYMVQTLHKNAGIARLLVELFEARFDPDLGEGRGERERAIEERIAEALNRVANLDEDRILRRFLNVVHASLRTNFYQPGSDGQPKPYLSIKLRSADVAELPDPRPMFEVFVYSPRVEAIHLRGGKVARGGIRWSDRPEDFRTEILGLIKAQMVKNAVIVPVGSKGGFVVKRPPTERDLYQKEGVECYKTLVRGLLDITDNYQGVGVVKPARVVCRDDDDPYLVVAADKGTATFSDIANGLSAEYGFWLGDAFASGGSAGYDHKEMAITSRGAWEAVKRHFREMGRDTQSEPFSVVGVGDMSGDVFGNGLLRSPHARLLGAFNHQHIFVDPAPDPATSFAERQRLFDLPRSSWMDYDQALLSTGGAIFDRKAKSVTISPQVAEVFELEAGTVTPDELIRAMLKAKVDLIWFGGIGTYVKASTETHLQVGDRANDSLRVDGRELRAKVIGEGANLALTQRGRVEFALQGGRLNTDAIDNSGGVDCSDHEVNIKILLNEVVAAGDLTVKQRDQLLVEMTAEVAELVLRDNYLQTQAITVATAQGAEGLDRQARMIRELERMGKLDRRIEGLPDEDAIAERMAAKKGLTRPEIAVLLAYSKITLFDELLHSDLPDDPVVAEDLVLYFPEALRERYAEAIQRHRLRREITATHVTNSMVNRVGPTFVTRLKMTTGLGAPEIARAYLQVRDAFELRPLWAAIEALDNVAPADAQTQMILATKTLVEGATTWLLKRRLRGKSVPTETLRAAAAALAERAEEVLPAAEVSDWRKRQRRLEKTHVPEPLAARVASLEFLASALDIAELAEDSRRPVQEVGSTFYHLGSRFGFDALREAADKLPTDTPWQREAKTGLADELFRLQSRLTADVLAGAGSGESVKAAIEHWVEGRADRYRRAKERVSEIKAAGTVDLAMLAVVRTQLADLIAG